MLKAGKSTRISETTEIVIALAKEQGIPTYRAADLLAEQRIAISYPSHPSRGLLLLEVLLLRCGGFAYLSRLVSPFLPSVKKSSPDIPQSAVCLQTSV